MESKNILIIDEDEVFTNSVNDLLKADGWYVQNANSLDLALSLLDHKDHEMVVSLSELNGQTLQHIVDSLCQHSAKAKLLILGNETNSQDAAQNAVKAIKHGAIDYLVKPITPETLKSTIQKHAQKKVKNTLVASDPKSQLLLQTAKDIANSTLSIIICGESGVGKEVIARYIHDNSPRRDYPFITVNCASIPDNMLELTLFGLQKNIDQWQIGKLEQANHSTILLDEISEMSLMMQAKLLSVLDEMLMSRINSSELINLDVRFIASTNKDLLQEIELGNFREDLYYRLNKFILHWVPLKERTLDIIPLANYLIRQYSEKLNRSTPILSQQAQNKMLSYHWPGNAREMENVIQRALLLQKGDLISVEDLRLETPGFKQREIKESYNYDIKQQEYHLIIQTLKQTNGNRTHAAKLLNISPRTLRYKLVKMREQGIAIPKPYKSKMIIV